MRIALVTNPTQHRWSPLDLDSIGGGEEAVVMLSRALARRGHDVTVFWDGAVGLDGSPSAESQVTYLPYDAEAGPFDAAIYANTPEMALTKPLAARCVLWTYQVRAFDPAPFGRIVVASRFMERGLSGLVPSCAGQITVVPYGYDAAMLWGSVDGQQSTRDPNLVLYASSPDRGLLDLVRLWPTVVAARPDARLHIAQGWDIFLALGGPSAHALHAEVQALAAAHPSILLAGRATYAEIHRLYRTAGVWAYYCTGGEVFCQTAVKAQVGGAVPVVKLWGGLHETVWSGLQATNPDDFAAALIAALDPEKQQELREAIGTNAVAQTWDALASRWEALLAEPEVKPVGPMLVVPPTPDNLLPRPGATAAPMLAQLIPEWCQRTGSQHPVCDPSLGIAVPVIPDGTSPDGMIVGWAFEDRVGPLTALSDGFPAGIPVMLATSYGPWRATQRQRALSRRDLLDLFGKQADLAMRAVPFDADGNGMMVTTFRYDPATLGQRNVTRVRRTAAPRETLALCMIVRDNEDVLRRALHSMQPIADEVCIIDTGSTDRTAQVVDDFRRDSGLSVRYEPGYSPRHCFDCGEEHPVGHMTYGHRLAGFETPRNQSVALASADWVQWLDSDETVLNPGAIEKYLRPNAFMGYGIKQHHFTIDPGAGKVDLPVRVFRRLSSGTVPGFVEVNGWPTYDPGTTARFAGLVHEHPGSAPTFENGIANVVVIGDVDIAHSGYHSERDRRGRFVRNWPLMAADRLKYPERRLGRFLWLRDLTHHFRYVLERSGNQLTPEALMYGEAALAAYQTDFLGSNDPFAADAMAYASAVSQALQRGMDVDVLIKARKPEVGPDEVLVQFAGRVHDRAELAKLIGGKTGELERWGGKWA